MCMIPKVIHAHITAMKLLCGVGSTKTSGAITWVAWAWDGYDQMGKTVIVKAFHMPSTPMLNAPPTEFYQVPLFGGWCPVFIHSFLIDVGKLLLNYTLVSSYINPWSHWWFWGSTKCPLLASSSEHALLTVPQYTMVSLYCKCSLVPRSSAADRGAGNRTRYHMCYELVEAIHH